MCQLKHTTICFWVWHNIFLVAQTKWISQAKHFSNSLGLMSSAKKSKSKQNKEKVKNFLLNDFNSISLATNLIAAFLMGYTCSRLTLILFKYSSPRVKEQMKMFQSSRYKSNLLYELCNQVSYDPITAQHWSNFRNGTISRTMGSSFSNKVPITINEPFNLVVFIFTVKFCIHLITLNLRTTWLKRRYANFHACRFRTIFVWKVMYHSTCQWKYFPECLRFIFNHFRLYSKLSPFCPFYVISAARKTEKPCAADYCMRLFWSRYLRCLFVT